jgi:hypothetical protein
VLLDDVPAGTAPLPDGPLEAGLHLLIVQAAGALRHAEVLEVAPGLTLSRRVELQPEPPEVAARGLIEEAARNAGPARRGALARVGELCGVARLLLVEDSPEGASARLLDLRTGEVSAMAPLGEGLPDQIGGWLQPASAPLAALAPAPESRPASVPLYKRWWFWAGVGAALAATSLTVYASTRPHDVVCCGSGP